MASGPTILASIGADTAPLRRDLAGAERDVERSAERMERAHAKGVRKLGKTIGGSDFGLARDVVGAFGLAGGASAALALLIPKLGEMREEAKKAKDELEWLLMPTQVASHANEADLLVRIEKLKEKLSEAAKQPGILKAALMGMGKGLDEMFGGTSDQEDPADVANQAAIALEKAQERLAEVRDLKNQEEMRKDMNRMDADAQKEGKERRKELSDMADKQAAEAIKNINQEKSAEIELGNVRSEQAGEEYDEEMRIQELKEKGRKEEEDVRKKANNEILASRRQTIQDEEDQFVADPSTHGEMERRRTARREERLRKRFRNRLQHETDEENRRAATGAVRHGLPNTLGRIENKDAADTARIQGEMNVTLKEIKIKMEGWVKSQ